MRSKRLDGHAALRVFAKELAEPALADEELAPEEEALASGWSVVDGPSVEDSRVVVSRGQNWAELEKQTEEGYVPSKFTEA